MTETMTLDEFRRKYQETGKGWQVKGADTAVGGSKAGGKGQTDWEAVLAEQIRLATLPEPVREHRFHPTRQWRFDFAWPSLMVACEVEGGVYAQGRHTRGKGYEEDCRKYNEAVARQWQLVRVTPGLIEQGEALVWLRTLLGGQEKAV